MLFTFMGSVSYDSPRHPGTKMRCPAGIKFFTTTRPPSFRLAQHITHHRSILHPNPRRRTMAPDKKGKKKATEATTSAAAASIDDIFAAPKKTEKGSSSQKKRGAEDEGVKAKKARVVETGRKEKAEKGDKKKKENGDKKTKEKKDNKEEVRTVEEVVDPSLAVDAAVERSKEARAAPAKGKRRDQKAVEEDRLWRDSRGDSDRESSLNSLRKEADEAGKRTEEGYLVFKEAELGIDPEAGGTPQCPFDCECCECLPSFLAERFG